MLERVTSSADLMNDDALRCMVYAAHVLKTPLKTLLSQVALDWYDGEAQILMNLVEAKGKRKGRKGSRVAVIPMAKAS
jgi:hypothetical protein